jgi:CDP-diacylglycerol--serine O-phosphatidyltransferase
MTLNSVLRNIPNLFTLLNLVFGCIAIIFILQTGQTIAYIDPQGFTQVDLPEKITWGALFIFGAAIVDFLDGFVARLFKASSEMGKQLDSLADVVSFGVAPGLIIYQLLRISYAQEEGGLDTSLMMLLPALLIPCAAAWRLAKFNIDSEQTYSFRGVPTPAVGLVIASFPLIIWFQVLDVQAYFIHKWILYGITVVLSWLMISNVPMMSLKFKDHSIRNNMPKLILLVLGIVAVLLLKWLAVPVIFIAYVILSLVFNKK